MGEGRGNVPVAESSIEKRRDVRLDEFCELASRLLDAPIALVCLVAGDRFEVVAAHGMPYETWSDPVGPWHHVLGAAEGRLISHDTRGDDRFSEATRAFVGIALETAEGDRVGTLSVLGTRAWTYSAEQIAAVELLAAAVLDRLEVRRLRAARTREGDFHAGRVAALERGNLKLAAEIERHKRAEERLVFEAHHDQLTRLANRTYLERRLDECLAAAKSGERSACVLFIDLDRFKRINDRLGHPMGDLLLTLVARRLERSVRPGDVVARLGGDEFMILLEGVGDIAEGRELARRILTTLAAPYRLQRTESFVTVSIGVAYVDAATDSVSEVLREADIAMYHAKEMGRNRVAVFEPFLRERDIAIATLESELRSAWEHRQFFLAYQPIVALKTDSLVGFEALLRWNHPKRGVVLPQEFITAVEEIGLILPLGEMVISEACRQLSRFQRDSRGSAALTMSVNLSSLQLGAPDLVEHVDRAVKLAEIDPETFVIELTESVILEDLAVATEVLARLRALGLRIHMDDFGTGYSSLNHLRQLPIDRIKIDGVFVSGSDGRLRDPEIVDTIVSLAHKLGIAAIAEGVETEAQRVQLLELGCDAAQGYLFSPAVVRAKAGTMLAAYVPGGASGLRSRPVA